jgi:outer membrane protein
MKKMTLAATLALLSASTVHADTVLGVYAGAGSWNASATGNAGEPSITLKELGVKEHANTYFYLALEHPVPVLPNIRLQQTNISSKQTAIIDQDFTIDGTTFSLAENVTSDFDLSHTDATLYYEILDNWVNFDLGVTARKFSGYVAAETTTEAKKVNLDQTLPMLYLKLQFDLPFSGLSVGIDGNYVSYQDSKLTDYTAKISYLFDSVLDIGVEAGYRKMSLTVDESDLQASIDLKGPYAALIAHF